MGEHRPARWSGQGKRSVRATGPARTSPPPAEPTQTIEATDAARALAAEHNVDLATVEHSGPRIGKGDVERHLNAHAEPEPDPEHEPVHEPDPESEPALELEVEPQTREADHA